MRCERHNRTLSITGLPQRFEGFNLPPILEIEISYTGGSNHRKGIALDQLIIPIIVEALSRYRAGSAEELTELATKAGLTPYDLRELFGIDHDRTNENSNLEVVGLALEGGDDPVWMREQILYAGYRKRHGAMPFHEWKVMVDMLVG